MQQRGRHGCDTNSDGRKYRWKEGRASYREATPRKGLRRLGGRRRVRRGAGWPGRLRGPAVSRAEPWRRPVRLCAQLGRFPGVSGVWLSSFRSDGKVLFRVFIGAGMRLRTLASGRSLGIPVMAGSSGRQAAASGTLEAVRGPRRAAHPPGGWRPRNRRGKAKRPAGTLPGFGAVC